MTGPDRVLAVTAHPDDVDFGAAGVVRSWTREGVAVTYCVCTSGEAGRSSGTFASEGAALRRSEQEAAAQAVGVRDVRFLDLPDGQLTPDLALRREITAVIREVRPQVVLTHTPEFNWTNPALLHPDHRAVGEAATAAVYPDARNEFAHPELLRRGLQPWTVAELWLSEAPPERINRAVDVTEHFDAKLAALRAHKSQTGHLDDLEGFMRGHLADNANRRGLPEGRLAEVFHVVDTA